MVFRQRRSTVTAHVGTVAIGSAQPIVVQSMTNTDTADPVSTAAQVAALAAAGSQLVRVTGHNDEAAEAGPGMLPRGPGRGWIRSAGDAPSGPATRRKSSCPSRSRMPPMLMPRAYGSLVSRP